MITMRNYEETIEKTSNVYASGEERLEKSLTALNREKPLQPYDEFVARIIARRNGNPKGLDAIKNSIINVSNNLNQL